MVNFNLLSFTGQVYNLLGRKTNQKEETKGGRGRSRLHLQQLHYVHVRKAFVFSFGTLLQGVWVSGGAFFTCLYVFSCLFVIAAPLFLPVLDPFKVYLDQKKLAPKIRFGIVKLGTSFEKKSPRKVF